MENLSPPNGSPEDIEAWNAMIDTMVIFVKASTNLVNTLSKKIKPQPILNAQDPLPRCEPECQICRPEPPKPKCGICVPENAASRKPSKKLSSIPVPCRTSKDPNGSRVFESIPDERQEAPKLAEKEEQPREPETETVEKLAIYETNRKKENWNVEESASEVAVDDPNVIESSGDNCICATIRVEKLEKDSDGYKCAVELNKSNTKLEEVEEELIEKVCACPATQSTTESEVKEIVFKLANAQQEIARIQEQMARLQRLNDNRGFVGQGGPNPATLYKEIMRNNTPCSYGEKLSQQRVIAPQQLRQYPPFAQGIPEKKLFFKKINQNGGSVIPARPMYPYSLAAQAQSRESSIQAGLVYHKTATSDCSAPQVPQQLVQLERMSSCLGASNPGSSGNFQWPYRLPPQLMPNPGFNYSTLAPKSSMNQMDNNATRKPNGGGLNRNGSLPCKRR